jgi:hypothetical protein
MANVQLPRHFSDAALPGTSIRRAKNKRPALYEPVPAILSSFEEAYLHWGYWILTFFP